MATLGVLRKTAKDLGIAPGDIRSATSAAELQALIVEALNGGTPKASKATSTKPARKAKASTSTRTATRTTARKATTTNGTTQRGRSAATKSKPAVQSTQGKAKRSTSSSSNGDSGRHMLSGVNYSQTEGWNAREGSAPDLIVAALRRFKGNREKVFNHLLPNIWDFVGKKMADGSKRGKESAETMLRYRISRTAWDFAMKTGQHEKSANRAEYGTQGTYKKAGAPKAAAKATGTARTAPKRSTAAKATRTAAKPQRAAQKRTAAPKRTVTKAKSTKPVAKKKTTARR